MICGESVDVTMIAMNDAVCCYFDVLNENCKYTVIVFLYMLWFYFYKISGR